METILEQLCQIHHLTVISIMLNSVNEPDHRVSVCAHFEADACEIGTAATFDAAFAITLRKVKDQRDNAAEAAWDRQQADLMESGGPDNSGYRRDMVAAGRGHLLTEA